ncbi:MAG: glucosamine-6-phosphate deaminase [Bacteroidota bacterium]|nr:glucosamine-6-phosphate deaminase [Bacteroidota bacterium]
MTQITPVTTLSADKIKVKVYNRRAEMGAEAARDVAEKITELLLKQPLVNIIFAAAPSQNEFLNALSRQNGIDWTRVNGFHMDEYVGISPDAPQSFAYFLQRKIFDKVPFRKVYYINGNAPDLNKECLRYADLLKENPVQIVCMGIGENTHIAFNDPHTANFNDPELVKVVILDDASRQQQVHDGCFASFDEVPPSAITLTVPALLGADYIYCIVPGSNKSTAVRHTINNKLSETYPSTSVKQHKNAVLYLDSDSAAEL